MLRDYVPGLSGVSENGTAAANTLAFAAIEASKPGQDINLGGKVYPVSSLPNGAQYYHGAFNVDGDIIWMPRNPLAHPFDGASMMVVNPIMRTYQGCALFWQKPSDPGHWLMAWREAEQHGTYNGSRVVFAETWDKMRRPISDYTDKKLIYTDSATDTTIHCPVTMSNDRIGFIARSLNEAGTYGNPKFFYSDDNGTTWSSVTITTSLNCTPYGDMLPYPSSAGGSDTGGYIWYYYQSTSTHAVYTTDYGATWTEQTLVATKGSLAAVQEASVVRIGNLNRWAMFSRNGTSLGVHLSTDMLTWGGAVAAVGTSVGNNPPTAFYAWGSIWILTTSRENNALITEHENSVLICRVDPDLLWSSGGTLGFSGWQVVSDAAFWPMGYPTVRQIREKHYAFMQLVEGHTAGGSTSRTSMLALLSRNSIETAPVQQQLQAVPQQNLIVDPEFLIWPRGTSVTGTTRKRVTPDASFARSSAVGGWTISRQTGWRNRYCMRIQRDSGNAGTQAMSLGFCFSTPDSLVAARQQDFMQAVFSLRRGANFSSSGNLISVQWRQTTTGDQVLTGNLALFPVGDTTVSTSTSTILVPTDWDNFRYVAGPIATTSAQVLINFGWTPVGTAGADDWFELEWSSSFGLGGVGYGYEQPRFLRRTYMQTVDDAAKLLQVFDVQSENGSRPIQFPGGAMMRIPDLTLSAGSSGSVTTSGFELTHTSAATITVTADAGL
jgi:hypothetical protein